ncbi:phage baseplate assembly protein V [Roseospira visakhapatnamensis]|uniref:Phage baseplate assembly protein V n=1 Tax=Roseospira visakhapatnamensis TaxID=390880 RepID=A0A7W6REL9_9PROT|nr:phage baseplate assembly protein V [Roseospira visakhapatnamensis]MBB4266892.1 phage baseplate assembly protein V [Roseospira visakhapatnamensis]
MADALAGGRGFGQAEANRRIANTVRLGRVVALDPGAARIKVQAGGNVTAWLPWTAGRAGPDRDWAAPEPGEQVLVLAPSGDLAQAVVVPGIYQARHPAPGDRADLRRTVFQDGTIQEYDRAAHAHRLDLSASGGSATVVSGDAELKLTPEAITLTVGGVRLTVSAAGVEIAGDVTVKGSIHASGTIIDDSGNTNHHTH